MWLARRFSVPVEQQPNVPTAAGGSAPLLPEPERGRLADACEDEMRTQLGSTWRVCHSMKYTQSPRCGAAGSVIRGRRARALDELRGEHVLGLRIQ